MAVLAHEIQVIPLNWQHLRRDIHVKKQLMILAMGAVATFSVSAAFAETASEGVMLTASDGARLGAVYRVADDGSAVVIMNGKMVTVPAATLARVDGKLTTSLKKNEVLSRR